MEFAREDLIGFRRPLAKTFALLGPVVVALTYLGVGFAAMVETAGYFFIITGAGLMLVGHELWPSLVAEYKERSNAKRKATADLKCGFGEAAFLNLEKAPRFFEFDYGVLAFADAGDFRTLFFSIPKGVEDPRWQLYAEGDMDRRVWRWLRLPVSREVVKFSTEGLKHARQGKQKVNQSVDAWEAINVALGEPLDGAIIHRPFAEVVDMVERMA
jgi:hypothetical protein